MNSSPVRFTGLFSGMDTQSMVQQLMRAESMRMDRLTSRRTILQWRQEDLRRTMSHIQDFRRDNTSLNNRRGGITDVTVWNAMRANAVGGSFPAGVTVHATGEAAAGRMDVVVRQHAQGDVARGTSSWHSAANPNNANQMRLGESMASFIARHHPDPAVNADNAFNAANSKQLRFATDADGNVLIGSNGAPVVYNEFNSVGTPATRLATDAQGNLLTVGEGANRRFVDHDRALAIANPDDRPDGFDEDNDPISVRFSTVEINGARVNIYSNDTVQSFMNRVNSNAAVGANLTFNTLRGQFELSARGTGVNAIVRTGEDSVGFLSVIGLDNLGGMRTTEDTRFAQLGGHRVGGSNTSDFAVGNMNFQHADPRNTTMGQFLGNAVFAAGTTNTRWALGADGNFLTDTNNNLVVFNSNNPDHSHGWSNRVLTDSITGLPIRDSNNNYQTFIPGVHSPAHIFNPNSSQYLLNAAGDAFELDSNGRRIRFVETDDPNHAHYGRSGAHVLLGANGQPILNPEDPDYPDRDRHRPFIATAPEAQPMPQFSATRAGEINIAGHNIRVYENESVQSFMNRVNNVLNAQRGDPTITDPNDPDYDPPITGPADPRFHNFIGFDTTNNRFFLEGFEDFLGAGGTVRTGSDAMGFLQRVGLANLQDPPNSTQSPPVGGAPGVWSDPDADVSVDGQSRFVNRAQDAEITINGTTITQNHNFFNIDGVHITINSATPPGASFTIDTTRNVDPLMNSIRQFVENFNDLIRHLNALHSTPRPRTNGNQFFEPLTNEQRNAMSETEVARWEEQARTGMLHRDSEIRNLHDAIRRGIMDPVNLPGGGTISLHQVGITTVGLGGAAGDRLIGALEIDEEVLRRALEERPDDVQNLFARPPTVPAANTAQRNARRNDIGLGHRLDDILANAVAHDGTLRRRAGVEGEVDGTTNPMSRNIRDYDNRIDQMQRWLLRRENHFFAMFARMEQAMAQANAQMDSLWMFGSM